MSRNHHHIVSEGYQRLFATSDGIRLIDKQTKVVKTVGTKGAFARKNFSSYLKDGSWSDELEDEWAIRENFALPHMRRLNDGARDDEAIGALKILAAIHYVRSYAFEKVLLRLIDEHFAIMPDQIASDAAAREAFVADYGRPPRPGEIEQLVIERWARETDGRAFLLERMAHGFGRTLEVLEPLHVQFVWPAKSGVDFVFADGPLVHSANDGRVTALEGLPLGDADQIYFPVGPRLLSLFMSMPEVFRDGAIPVDQVQLLNKKTWRAALRMLGAQPDTNVKRSLLQWDLKVLD